VCHQAPPRGGANNKWGSVRPNARQVSMLTVRGLPNRTLCESKSNNTEVYQFDCRMQSNDCRKGPENLTSIQAPRNLSLPKKTAEMQVLVF
jgi:hypothetical protein